MAEIHILTNSHQECVLKCYKTDSSGGNVDINLASVLVRPDETFNRNNAKVTIKELFWGAKKDKQIDISRIITYANNELHGHYYLINSGNYDFYGFVDDVYANSDIRITGDGPFHVIIKLGKVSGYTIS